MNRWLKTSTLLASLALGAVSLGCSGSAVAENPAVNADGVAIKAPVTTATRGRVKVVADALGDVPLRSAQRTQIETLTASAEAQHVAVRAARQGLMLALADQISAGQVDRNALQPKIDATVAAAFTAQAAERAGLEQLHAILDVSQRSLFVDALQARMQARRQLGEPGKAAGWHAAGAWKARWADLNLTPDQEAQIKSIMESEFAAHHGQFKGGFERGQKIFEAFRGDAFAIDQVAPPLDVRARTAEMTGRFVDIAAQVLPLLTSEQRTIAAQKLHERAAVAAPDTEESAGPVLE
jgi:Spy/CpxP family protein refolding chaperone